MDHAGRQSAFASALLDPALPPPAGLTGARGTADARRFAVYRNNVAVGLMRALSHRFPVTEKLVGAAFFASMARAYAAGNKPSSPLVFAYGDGFPDFIAGFDAAAGLPYLADLARLEANWTRAYHAADEAPLDIGALAALGESMGAARLRAHPAASLVCSVFPVGSLWQAHQADSVAPAALHGSECVLVARPGLAVTVHVLPPQDAAFAAALLDGASIGAAAEQAIAADENFDFGAAIVGLVSLGAFTSLEPGADDDD